MKKITTLLILVSLVASLFLLPGCGKKEPDVIKIGAVLPLTGDAAVWGNNTKQGVDLALEEINAAGGVLGKKVEVIYEDSKALPQEGVSGYKKLTTVDKVEAIIDNSISSVTLAMAPIAEKDHVVILATGATNPSITNAGDYIFRIWNSDAYEGEVMAEYALNDLGCKKVAILYINNDYGKGLEGVFTREFQKIGGEIVSDQSYEQNATDVKTQLSKISAQKPDGIYLVGYPKEIPIALKQIKEMGIDVKMMGTVAMFDPQIIENAGDAAEGLVFPYPKDPTGEAVAHFLQAFKEKYNKEPGITADVGYDALKMIVKAIEITDEYKGETVREGLNELHEYEGASGVMTFDQFGDVHKPMGMKVIKGGEFNWLN